MASFAIPQRSCGEQLRIYSFPGANGSNGNGAGDINKMLLSTSGLALINTLLEDGKLGSLIGQVSNLVRSNNGSIPPEALTAMISSVEKPSQNNNQDGMQTS